MNKTITKKVQVQQWLPHVIGLLFIIILPLFVFSQSDEWLKNWNYRYYFKLFVMGIAFYVNYLIFVPRLFITGRKGLFYCALVVFTYILLSLSQAVSVQLKLAPSPRTVSVKRRPRGYKVETKPLTRLFEMEPRKFDDLFLLLLVFGFSTGMGVLQHVKSEEKKKNDEEKVHTETELAYLKNQISPHFFFNSLNNIYSLIAINGEEAQKAIEKLSNLMRYLIYDTDKKTVSLQKEFEFVKNYIGMMKHRLSPKVTITVNIDQYVPEIKIPPLIFIPFIENAFKHGISYRESSFVTIQLGVHNDLIRFTCINSIPQSGNDNKEEQGGVGIVNVKKRLALIYGSSAHLIQEIQENTYVINLTLPTKVNV